MKKLLLLIGLVVFLTPMVVSAEKICFSNENALLELFESNNLTPKFETLEENKVTKKVW